MNEGIGLAPEEIVVDSDVTLAPVMPEDSEEMFTLIDSDRPHFTQYGDDTAGKYRTLEDMQDRNAHQAPNERRFVIRNGGDIVGFVKLTDQGEQGWELGYWLGSQHERHGYMTRSAKALTQYGFDRLGARRIFALVHMENFPSRGVLERIGFQYEGKSERKAGEVIYAKTPPTA